MSIVPFVEGSGGLVPYSPSQLVDLRDRIGRFITESGSSVRLTISYIDDAGIWRSENGQVDLNEAQDGLIWRRLDTLNRLHGHFTPIAWPVPGVYYGNVRPLSLNDRVNETLTAFQAALHSSFQEFESRRDDHFRAYNQAVLDVSAHRADLERTAGLANAQTQVLTSVTNTLNEQLAALEQRRARIEADKGELAVQQAELTRIRTELEKTAVNQSDHKDALAAQKAALEAFEESLKAKEANLARAQSALASDQIIANTQRLKAMTDANSASRAAFPPRSSTASLPPFKPPTLPLRTATPERLPEKRTQLDSRWVPHSVATWRLEQAEDIPLTELRLYATLPGASSSLRTKSLRTALLSWMESAIELDAWNEAPSFVAIGDGIVRALREIHAIENGVDAKQLQSKLHSLDLANDPVGLAIAESQRVPAQKRKFRHTPSKPDVPKRQGGAKGGTQLQ